MKQKVLDLFLYITSKIDHSIFCLSPESGNVQTTSAFASELQVDWFVSKNLPYRLSNFEPD